MFIEAIALHTYTEIFFLPTLKLNPTGSLPSEGQCSKVNLQLVKLPSYTVR